MFKATNPYDESVTKATAETLTSEDWQVNLDICDKVSSEGEVGARNCVQAIQKRIVHRNANVQLYSLTLSDAIAKNCGVEAHRELASRAFTQTLSRVVSDRNTHEKVRDKTLELLKEWEKDFKASEESASMVKETIDALRAQGYYKSENAREDEQPPPNEPSSELLRREDEELRRVLELSLQDQGGRSGGAYAAYGDASGGGASGSRTGAGAAQPALDKTLPDHPPQQQQQQQQAPVAQPPVSTPTTRAPSRVRALYDFTPSEVGELAFSKGDLIRVLDSVYEHWWRGELRGEAGIFPVNYVEILPDPTPAEIQREAEQEAQIFAQAHDIDRLLAKLRTLDPNTANLADDEELQDLYQSSLAMRPKIVRLIDRYSTKVQELRAMNDKFVSARSTFDVMMGAAQGAVQGQQQQGQYYQQQQYYPQQQQQQQPTASTPYYPQQQAYYQPQPQQQQQAYAQQPATVVPPHAAPQEDEKRRLYEQARREAEAYHPAYGPGGSGSGSAPHAPQ